MAMWLYQLSQEYLTVNNYRLDIWEGQSWRWPVYTIRAEERPAPGDTVVFYYARTGCPEPGFYGWGIILSATNEGTTNERERNITFRPVPPSDQLKVCPWWNKAARELGDLIRGDVPRANLFLVPDGLVQTLALRIAGWCAGRPIPEDQ